MFILIDYLYIYIFWNSFESQNNKEFKYLKIKKQRILFNK
jgi:hypothetical protein